MKTEFEWTLLANATVHVLSWNVNTNLSSLNQTTVSATQHDYIYICILKRTVVGIYVLDKATVDGKDVLSQI